MRRNRGFTIVELVFVIMIGAVLTGVAVQAFGGALSRLSASGARRAFATYHARARTAAIETGLPSALWISAVGDSLVLFRNGVITEGINLRREFDANVVMDSTTLTICMGPRGYAMSSCNSFTSAQTIQFEVGNTSVPIEVLPLGQLVY